MNFVTPWKFMDTIVALSTPLGVSGIGLIRLSGPNCYHLACEIFHKEQVNTRYSYHGQYHTLKEADVLDDPLFVYFEPKASYTGEAMLEISCHGNPLILQSVIRDCIERGCRQADPGEFTRRAFLNGVIDLCQAEAVEDVIHSQSLQALTIARKQVGGSLSRSIQKFIQILTDQIAFIEAYLDFPEEDLPEESREEFKENLKKILGSIEKLINEHRFYTPLHNGIRVAIVGAPNAGKSTLLNLLLGQNRAIVSEIPGTTRDFISENYLLGPYTLKLIDTAGIHTAFDGIEKVGIEKTYEQIQLSDIALWVVDGHATPLEVLKRISSDLNLEKTLVVLNKSDLGIRDDIKSFLKDYPSITITLRDDVNLNCIKTVLLSFLDDHYKNFSQVEFMIHERHADALVKVHQSLMNAEALLRDQGYDDCLAAELKEGLHALEQIVGRVDYECVLDKIFSTFCIGK